MLHFNGYSSKCLLSPKSVCCQLLQSSGISRCFRSVDLFAVETFDFNKKKCFKRYILRIFNPLAKKSALSHSFANILYLWIQQGFHEPQFIQSYFSRKKITKKMLCPTSWMSFSNNNNNNRISPFVLSDPWVPPPKKKYKKSGTRCFLISFMMRGTLEVVSTSWEGPACRWNTMASTRWEICDSANRCSQQIFSHLWWWKNGGWILYNPNP